jgi:hypothetical protein
VFKRVCFLVLAAAAFIAMPNTLFAAHALTGRVYDAIDCRDSALQPVKAYLPGNPDVYASGTVNPETNHYMVNIEAVFPNWQIGWVMYVEVVDKGDGYTAGPVSVTLTGNGYDVPPAMTLHKDGIVQDPSYPDCPDTDGDYTNDASDNCPLIPNWQQYDNDGDGAGDACDNCSLPNPGQEDCQPNSIGDVCDLADGTSRDCNMDEVPDECQPGDFDGNGTVDLDDYSAFASEFLGPDATQACPFFDLDSDEDADLRDFASFGALTGG